MKLAVEAGREAFLAADAAQALRGQPELAHGRADRLMRGALACVALAIVLARPAAAVPLTPTRSRALQRRGRPGHCMRLVEAQQLKRLPGLATRDGNTLRIALFPSGSTTFDDVDTLSAGRASRCGLLERRERGRAVDDARRRGELLLLQRTTGRRTAQPSSPSSRPTGSGSSPRTSAPSAARTCSCVAHLARGRAARGEWKPARPGTTPASNGRTRTRSSRGDPRAAPRPGRWNASWRAGLGQAHAVSDAQDADAPRHRPVRSFVLRRAACRRPSTAPSTICCPVRAALAARRWTSRRSSAGRRRSCWRSASDGETTARSPPRNRSATSSDRGARAGGALLKRVEAIGLANVRVIRHDAVEVVEHMIPPDSLRRARLLPGSVAQEAAQSAAC